MMPSSQGIDGYRESTSAVSSWHPIGRDCGNLVKRSVVSLSEPGIRLSSGAVNAVMYLSSQCRLELCVATIGLPANVPVVELSGL